MIKKTHKSKDKKINFNFPILTLGILILLYTVFFSIITIDNINKFSTPAYDIGVYDQGTWLLSNFKTPFLTIEGVHFFGDHGHFIMLFVVPFYWIWSNIRVSLVLQSLALGLGVIPIYLLAKEKLKNKWVPFIFVIVYLFFPALHYLNLENFHPDSFAVPLLLFSFYFAYKKKPIFYFIFICLSLLVKEDIAATVFMLGLYIFIFLDRKVGLSTCIFSLFWLFFIYEVGLTYFNGIGSLHSKGGHGTFNIFGRGPFEALKNMILNPRKVIEIINTKTNHHYLFSLFSPVGFLSVLDIPSLLIALLSLGINLITGWPYAHLIEYHYTRTIIPFIFISLVIGFSNLSNFLEKKKLKFRNVIILLFFVILITGTVYGNFYITAWDTSLKNLKWIYNKISNFGKLSEREVNIYNQINKIPVDAKVSATYLIVPHISHREYIYMFPHPFTGCYWKGFFPDCRPKFSPNVTTADIDYLIIDSTPTEEEMNNIIKPLVQKGTFYETYQSDYITVLRRNHTVIYDYKFNS